jgi:hypothetical protein
MMGPFQRPGLWSVEYAQEKVFRWGLARLFVSRHLSLGSAGQRKETPRSRIVVLAARSLSIMTTSTLEHSQLTLALRSSPIPALRKLSLAESEATVTILGQVTSYYLKQLAQETILPLLDGRQLLNRVQVVATTAMQNT